MQPLILSLIIVLATPAVVLGCPAVKGEHSGPLPGGKWVDNCHACLKESHCAFVWKPSTEVPAAGAGPTYDYACQYRDTAGHLEQALQQSADGTKRRAYYQWSGDCRDERPRQIVEPSDVKLAASIADDWLPLQHRSTPQPCLLTVEGDADVGKDWQTLMTTKAIASTLWHRHSSPVVHEKISKVEFSGPRVGPGSRTLTDKGRALLLKLKNMCNVLILDGHGTGNVYAGIPIQKNDDGTTAEAQCGSLRSCLKGFKGSGIHILSCFCKKTDKAWMTADQGWWGLVKTCSDQFIYPCYEDKDKTWHQCECPEDMAATWDNMWSPASGSQLKSEAELEREATVAVAEKAKCKRMNLPL